MADSSPGMVAETTRPSGVVVFLQRLVKEKPLGTVGGIITVLLLLTGIFAGLVAPYGLNQTHVEVRLSPPSARFWLGTDSLGRDVLSRIIFGARISVIVGLGGAGLATILAVVIGVMCGYSGGKFDLIVQRFVDAWMCMPSLIFLMIMMTILGPGLWQVIIVVGLRWGIAGSRTVRGATISVRENAYVQAAVAIGCSKTRTITRHILPNIVAPTIILFTTWVPAMMITEASLSFLGFGVPPPFPSWGGMISGAGRQYMFKAPWVVIWPGLALAIVIYGVNMFGDALRDLLDPRLGGGVGRYGLRSQERSITEPDDRLKEKSGMAASAVGKSEKRLE